MPSGSTAAAIQSLRLRGFAGLQFCGFKPRLPRMAASAALAVFGDADDIDRPHAPKRILHLSALHFAASLARDDGVF
jgi:hypothetical protein